MIKNIGSILFLSGMFFCMPIGIVHAQRNVLEKIIADDRSSFSAWAQQPEQYDIQVLYTQIDRDAKGTPRFTTHRFGTDPNRYFYPASTVKMPIAFLALEKLNELAIQGLDKDSPMFHFAATPPQTAALADETSPNHLPSVANYIRKIFLVSDNDAYNRLYEFLGQAHINDKLHGKGFTDTRIIHRLSVSGYDTLGNQLTNPVAFANDRGICYQQGEVRSRFYDDLGLSGQLKGVAYIDGEDKKVDAPFDFRYKNYVSLQDLHDMLKAVFFPAAVSPRERFNLTPDDYAFLREAMGQRPQESDFPSYDEPDNYVKFWMYGDVQDSTFQIPKNVRIYNKVGWAYGTLTDAAYIVDVDAGIEFFLVGTIHVNANQTFNDGVYEYEDIGMPFFGELGRAVYEWERKRKRR